MRQLIMSQHGEIKVQEDSNGRKTQVDTQITEVVDGPETPGARSLEDHTCRSSQCREAMEASLRSRKI